jgi:hypothetical protein
MSIKPIVRELVDATGIITSAQEVAEALAHHDPVGALQSGFEFTKGVVELPHYVSIAVERGTVIAALAAEYIPISVDESLIHFLETPGVKDTLAAVGIAVASMEIVVNAIQLHRQTTVLDAIPSISENGKDPLDSSLELIKTLDRLEDLNFNTFKSTLPKHLQESIKNHGDENAFVNLKTDVATGKPTAAKNLVCKIREYALRKRIVHMIGILSALCVLVASVGVLIGFPPLAILIFSVVGIALTCTRYILHKGWVENSQAGFNWKLIFPEFMQIGKLATDKTPAPIELGHISHTISAKHLIEQPGLISSMIYHEQDDEEEELIEAADRGKWIELEEVESLIPAEAEIPTDLRIAHKKRAAQISPTLHRPHKRPDITHWNPLPTSKKTNFIDYLALRVLNLNKNNPHTLTHVVQ